MSRIDINRAGAETLAQLNGIGDILAGRIITYRETVHPFEETIELTAVPGISERMVRALADEIMVEPASAPEGPESALAEDDAPVAETAPAQTQPTPAMESAAAELPAEAESVGEGAEEEAPPEVDVILLPDETGAIAAEADVAEPAALEEETTAPSAAETDDEEPQLAADIPAEAPPRAEVPAKAAPPPRRGCLHTILTALIGALLGSALTLLLLVALNGTLNFATPAQVAGVRGQVEMQTQEQSGLDEEVGLLSTRVSEAIAAEATTAADLAGTTDSLERDLGEQAGDIDALQTETASLADRINALSNAAENFDLFLDGMRDLLIELRGLPPLPTATATPIPTVETTATETVGAGTPAAEETAEVTSTPTPFLTRTPRPTATPLVSPTPTSINIP